MTEKPNESHEEVVLARSQLVESTGRSETLDSNLLAAWIDRTIDDRDAAAIERALASDPELRKFAAELRTDGPLERVTIPSEVLRTLHAIRQPAPPLAFGGSDRGRWLAAAAAVAIAALGFLAGRQSIHQSTSSNADLLATATFEVFTDESNDELHDEFLGIELGGPAQ